MCVRVRNQHQLCLFFFLKMHIYIVGNYVNHILLLNIVFILLLFILTLTHNVSQHYTHVQNINNTCIWGWHAKPVGFIETLQSINSRHGEQHTTVQHINYYFHPNCIYKNENMYLKFNIDMVINISTRWYNKDINQNYTNIWYCLNWISKQSWT